jgi:hypothetical protein
MLLFLYQHPSVCEDRRIFFVKITEKKNNVSKNCVYLQRNNNTSQ